MRGNTAIMRLKKEGIARSGELFQYDYGQRLIFEGVELPVAYEVHFSNKEHGESKTSIGDSTGVDIPDEYLLTGENIHVWLFLHDGEDDGETEYHGIISVHKRAKPKNAEPTPVQQDVITQTIAALDDAVEEVEGIAEGIPETINQALQEAKDSGEFDGFSPIATVEKTGHTATITITDVNGTTTAEVKDGSEELIDDNAGAGVRDKTWSADKIATAIGDINSFDIVIVQSLPAVGKEHTIYFVPKTGSQGDSYDEYLYLDSHWEMIGTTDVDVSTKADKTDTILLTTLSRGRKSGTATGANSFAFGQDVTASANNTHAEGYNTKATGAGGHAEGSNTTASGQYSHAEGEATVASGLRAHAEGYLANATGSYSHAEGYGTLGKGALGKADHAEGYQTVANSGATASNYGAHAEGKNTTASGNGAHAEGFASTAMGTGAHAEGQLTMASAPSSHAGGTSTIANHADQHVFGTLNIPDPSSESVSNHGIYAEIVGNGTSEQARSNARTLDWQGNERLMGDLYIHCNLDGTGGTKVGGGGGGGADIDDTAGAGDTDKAWSADKLVTEFGNKLNAPSLGEKRNVLTLDNNRRPAWAENINVYEVTIPVEANSTSLPKYNIFNIRNDNITTKSRVIGWESTTAKYYTYLNYTLESAYTSMPGVVSGDLEILPGAPAGTIKLYIADVA